MVAYVRDGISRESIEILFVCKAVHMTQHHQKQRLLLAENLDCFEKSHSVLLVSPNAATKADWIKQPEEK